MKRTRARPWTKIVAGVVAISAFAGPSAYAWPRDGAAVYKPSGLTMALEYGESAFVGLSNDGQGSYTIGVATARDHAFLGEGRSGLEYTDGYIPAEARYAFTGHFFSMTRNDDACVFIQGDPAVTTPEVQCWAFNDGSLTLHSDEFGDPFAWSVPRNVGQGFPYGYVVGDFDGDVWDEVLTVEPSGGGAVFWKYDDASRQFKPEPAQLDLTPYNLKGPLQFQTVNGGWLAVYDQGGAQVIILESTGSPSGVTFAFYGSVRVPYGNIQVAFGDADGDGSDDLLINDLDRGVLDWRNLGAPAGSRLPVSQGQISVTPGQYVTFAWTNPDYFSFSEEDLVVYNPKNDWISIEEDHTNGTSEDYEWYWTFTGTDVRRAMGL